MSDDLTLEQAQRMLQQRQADRNQEIGQELDALKRRFGFELIGVPRITQDGRIVADVAIVLANQE